MAAQVKEKDKPAPARSNVAARNVVTTGQLLHRACQRMDALFSVHANHETLTPRQVVVLASLKSHGPMCQTELTFVTGIDRSTLADIVRRLLAQRMITRRQSVEDTRQKICSISDLGEQLLDVGSKASKSTDESLSRILQRDEKAELRRLLEKLIDADLENVA
jgi:DNA-binding MarR family transcriptional regulator